MIFRSTIIAFLAACAVTPALAGPSEQHSAQALDHSGAAASEGSAAVASGVAEVTSVPIILFGSSVAVTGAALEEVGEGSVDLGVELNRAATGVPARTPTITPDGPPKLD